MIINGKRKPKPAKLLFPGLRLEQPIFKGQEITTLTGEIFEGFTHYLFGGRRGTINSTADMCPDLEEDDGSLIESKGSNFHSGHKINHEQADFYLRSGKPSRYVLWSYAARDLKKNYKTVGGIVEAVVNTTQYLDILDVKIIKAMCERSESVEGLRTYPHWCPRFHLSDPDPILVVRQTFLRRLRSDPYKVLFRELGLQEGTYEYSAQGTLQAEATFDGRNWKTGNFVAWSISEKVPF